MLKKDIWFAGFRDGQEGSSFCNSFLHIHGACDLDTQKEALFHYSIAIYCLDLCKSPSYIIFLF